MTLDVVHRFESGKSDGSDPTLVRPSNWNASHKISTAAGKLIGSDTSGPAEAQELPGAFDADGNFTLTAATAFFLGARGTTGQRPVSLSSGQERWNSTTTKKEFYDGTAWQNVATETYVTTAIAAVSVSAGVVGFISGLTYQVSGVNEIDVAVGSCVSSDASQFIAIAAATKRVDTAWAADNGPTPTGSLDTGSVADSPYFIFAIKNPTSGLTAILTSLSSTAPTMPAGYTLKRLIGWLRRSGGDIVAFHTYELSGGGLDYKWDVPTLDVAAVTVGTSRILEALGTPKQVPIGVSVIADLSVQLDFTNGEARALNISCPDQPDAAVAFGSAILGTTGFTQIISLSAGSQSISANVGSIVWQNSVRTDTSGQVALRASGASATVSASVIGFEWSRR